MQFAPRTHRARTRLDRAGPAFTWLFAACDAARGAGQSWPPHIYVPVPALNEALPAQFDRMPRGHVVALRQLGASGIAYVTSAGLTYATWRMTQGIYRVDPALYSALIDTHAADDVPAQVLTRLPEWCIYIETPGLSVPPAAGSNESVPLHGAWCRIDSDGRQDLLAVTIDIDAGDPIILPTQHIALARGSVEQCVTAALESWVEHGGRVTSPAAEVTAGVASWLRPVINLLLYICTTADISGKRGQPGNPEPVRTRRHGWRLFPADGVTAWDVGVRMGAALRAAYASAETQHDSEGAGRTVRGHVRRAHWHTFLAGARKRPDGSAIAPADRQHDVRWMPPIPVNLGSVDELPAVIRRVAP